MVRQALVTRRLLGLGIAATVTVGPPSLWTRTASANNHEERAPRSYSLGVFPFLPALTLDRVFAPIVREINAGTRSTVHFRTKPDFETFSKEMTGGGYDFIFVHPFLYVDAADQDGYRPLVRAKAPMTAVIVTTANSSLQSINDLHGRTLALPPQLSAVSEMLKGDIIDANRRIPSDISIRHFLSKSSCIQALAIGKADACGLPRFAIAHFKGKMVPKLRIIHETKPLASLTFATHPRVDQTVHTRVRDFLLNWQSTEEAQSILGERGWHGLIEAHDRDFDVVRQYRQRMTAFLNRERSHAP